MKNDDDGFKATSLKIPISLTGALINSIKMFKIDTINGSSFDLFPYDRNSSAMSPFIKITFVFQVLNGFLNFCAAALFYFFASSF
jgi:hypothetical protein